MDIKEQVLKEMRNPEIYLKNVVDYVEKRVKYVFGIACEEKLSKNQASAKETSSKQKFLRRGR